MAFFEEGLSEYLEAVIYLTEIKRQKGGTNGGTVDILGWDLEWRSLDALISAIDQILIRKLNDFDSLVNDPLIIDCGANIGVSVLYYKRRYPSARIIAFEPDPEFFPILKRNLQRNGASDVQVIEAAAWISEGRTNWVAEYADGSRIATRGLVSPTSATVQAVDLLDYLDEPVDLLKIDIEGAEFAVIPHIKNKLNNVKAISLECHLESDSSFELSRVLTTLSEAGFQTSINSFGEWRDLTRQPSRPGLRSFGYLVLSCWRKLSPARHLDVPDWLPAAGMNPLLEIKKIEDFSNDQERKFLKLLYSIVTGFQSEHDLSQIFEFQRLKGPFCSEGGVCFSAELDKFSQFADSTESPRRSGLYMFEDGEPLTRSHSQHADIRRKGGGRYSHWNHALFFSSSDGTDPNINGREYFIILIQK